MNKNFVDQVIDLLDSVGEGGEEIILANENKIDTLADYARTTAIYINSSEQGKEIFKDKTPVEIFNHMILKIVESPTTLHRDAAVLIIIPHLSDAVKKVKTSQNKPVIQD